MLLVNVRTGITAVLVVILTLAASSCWLREKKGFVATKDNATLRMTAQGQIVGGHGQHGGDVWLGIPFAEPPVNELRWREPQPPTHWTGVREAIEYGPACPQFGSPMGGGGHDGQLIGSEDCLYLNVFAPGFGSGSVPKGPDRLPVMFWIHGGGNSIGRASMYDASKLASENHVIVVTTQYRLGPLGWFRQKSLRASAADPQEASGDFGTLDLIRGLEWVRENISEFGGDPENVTIFGESAGGQNVYSLLVSPPAHGLFQRAIVESGGLSRTAATDAENFTDDASPGHRNSSNEVVARQLVEDGLVPDRAAAKARIASKDDASLASYLRSWSLSKLFGQYETNQKLGMLDMPLVINDGAVLPTDWLDRLAKADGWNKVPVIVGTNRDEAKLFLFFNPLLIHRILGFIPRFINEDRYEAAAAAMSQTWKTTGADMPAAAMHQSGENNVFVYRFDWHGEPRIAGADLSKMLGAAHAMEIPFVFGNFDFERTMSRLFTQDSAPERNALSDAMMTYWTQFARSGSPNGSSRSDLPSWPAWNATPQFQVLDTASEGGIRSAVETRSMAQIIADIDADARLPTQREKCAVFHELAGWTHGIDKASYIHVGQHGCADFPFDKFPWTDR